MLTHDKLMNSAVIADELVYSGDGSPTKGVGQNNSAVRKHSRWNFLLSKKNCQKVFEKCYVSFLNADFLFRALFSK